MSAERRADTDQPVNGSHKIDENRNGTVIVDLQHHGDVNRKLDSKTSFKRSSSSNKKDESQVGLSRARRLAQGQSIKIHLFAALPVEVDGEPWFQQPCTLAISHHGQAFMLKRAAEEPLGHAAAIITDVLENAETNHVISAVPKRVLLQEMATSHLSRSKPLKTSHLFETSHLHRHWARENRKFIFNAFGIDPPPESLDGGRIRLSWLRENYSNNPVRPDEDGWAYCLRASVMYVIGSYLIPDDCTGLVSAQYLGLLDNLQEVGSYAWGAAAWASLHNSLDRGIINGLAYNLMVFAIEHIEPPRIDGDQSVKRCQRKCPMEKGAHNWIENLKIIVDITMTGGLLVGDGRAKGACK